tara:strand:+ start:1491 stop:1673 length:183 start_codon:yes stop_codon:yes gene_type:complete
MKEGDRINKVMVMNDGEEIKRSGEVLSITDDTVRIRWNSMTSNARGSKSLETVEWLKNIT